MIPARSSGHNKHHSIERRLRVSETPSQRIWIEIHKVLLELLGVGGAPILRLCHLDPGIGVVVGREVVSVPRGDAGRHEHVERHLEEGDKRIELQVGRDIGATVGTKPVWLRVCQIEGEERHRIAGILQVHNPNRTPIGVPEVGEAVLGHEADHGAVAKDWSPPR